jgi:hypothetical protein
MMRKIKSPWYAALWIGIWTAALVWFAVSGIFKGKELITIGIVWLVLVGATVWVLINRIVADRKTASKQSPQTPQKPALNALCPCGSGKKYKRCCGET